MALKVALKVVLNTTLSWKFRLITWNCPIELICERGRVGNFQLLHALLSIILTFTAVPESPSQVDLFFYPTVWEDAILRFPF